MGAMCRRFNSWRSWIGGEAFGGPPGAIDNSGLLDGDKVGLRPGLVEQKDFHVVPETVWNRFEGARSRRLAASSLTSAPRGALLRSPCSPIAFPSLFLHCAPLLTPPQRGMGAGRR